MRKLMSHLVFVQMQVLMAPHGAFGVRQGTPKVSL